MLLYLAYVTSGIELHRSKVYPEQCGNSRLAVYTSVVILMYLSHLLNTGRFCRGFVVTWLPI